MAALKPIVVIRAKGRDIFTGYISSTGRLRSPFVNRDSLYGDRDALRHVFQNQFAGIYPLTYIKEGEYADKLLVVVEGSLDEDHWFVVSGGEVPELRNQFIRLWFLSSEVALVSESDVGRLDDVLGLRDWSPEEIQAAKRGLYSLEAYTRNLGIRRRQRELAAV